MDEKILLTVKTTMEKEDYRKFLYLATFKRSKIVIPLMLLISGAAAAVLAFADGTFGVLKFFIFWIILTAVAIGTVLFKVEHKNNQRIKTDKTGVFGRWETIDYYDEYLILTSSESYNKFRYDQLYQILESRDYFLCYFNVNMAALIRKKDMDMQTQEKLRALLKEKMKDKFKRM